MKNDSGPKVTAKEKIRRRAPIKIVLRRLPCGFTWDQLRTQLEPLPETEFLQFVPADSEEDEYKFARAYFVFKNDEDIVSFRDRFNGYVFVDSLGTESVGLVELAPNPKVARHRREECKKRDRRCATIETDLEFKQFLDEREHPVKPEILSVEERIKEIEEKERSLIESSVQETPLTQYMIRKSDEKFRRLQDKKRIRDEERKMRLQRLFEKEQKERAERKEAKKITEFRNSKADPGLFRENPHKENKKEKKTEDKSGESGEKDYGKLKEDPDRISRVVERRLRGDFSLKKEREKGKNGRERDVFSERSTTTEKLEKSKGGLSENGARPIKEKLKDMDEDFTERTTLPYRKNSNVRLTLSTKENAADSSDATKRPRRNKDRPERAIYQPSAARRRMVATSAFAKETGNESKTQNFTDSSGKD